MSAQPDHWPFMCESEWRIAREELMREKDPDETAEDAFWRRMAAIDAMHRVEVKYERPAG